MVNRIPDLEIATRESGLAWQRLDLKDIYADWMDTFGDDERLKCLLRPKVAEDYADPQFRDFICTHLRAALEAVPTEEAFRTVYAVTGLMELYDFIHVSDVLEALKPRYPGILLVFFPGEREGKTYRFLDARTSWDYLAVPILAES
jgi:hypothetical protein